MSLIARTKTKKELKTKVGEYAADWLTETSMFGPEIKPNASITCTNHPKRSWFAAVKLDAECKIMKVT